MKVDTHGKRSPCHPTSNRRRGASGARGEKYVTGHGGVTVQALCGNSATGTPFKLRQIQKIGTWNVRGLQQNPGKLLMIEKEMVRVNLNICGLSETHWQKSGHFLTDNHAVYFSGNDTKSQNGVAILIPKHQRNCVLGYEPISDRIIRIKLKASPTNLNLIQVYASTSAASEEVIENFYYYWTTVLRKFPTESYSLSWAILTPKYVKIHIC